MHHVARLSGALLRRGSARLSGEFMSFLAEPTVRFTTLLFLFVTYFSELFIVQLCDCGSCEVPD